MRAKPLKIVTLFWLIIITPLFGVLPTLAILPLGLISRSAQFLLLAIVRDLSGIFFDDPHPEIMDAWPPLNNAYLGIVGISVCTIGCGLIFLLCRKRKEGVRSFV